MDQTSATNPTDAAPQQGPQESLPAEQPADSQPGFRSRGQARRRARFLRRARELAYRDLGGLVFNLHRFGQRNDALVLAKLATLGHIDKELRAIETALGERRPVTVLREAGITACPRCAAIHGSEDRFCPNCGLPMARNADLPVAGASTAEPPAPAPQPSVGPGPTQSPAPLAPPAQPSPAAQPAATAAQPATPSVPAAAPVAQPVAPSTRVAAATPSQQTAAPGAPLTAEHLATAGSGRSPVPPIRGNDGESPASAGPEEPTEIIHPPAQGS